jgi:ATP-binding cassette, subfamily B, bacterial
MNRLRHLLAAIRLTTRAAPGTVLAYTAVALVGAVVPVISAWLMKSILDQLGSRSGSWSALLPSALGLAGAGVVTGTLPHASRYLQASLNRSVALLSIDRLYRSVNRQVGIGRLEEPGFRDRLRMAQQAARTGPAQLVDDGLTIVRSVLTIGGFLGYLIVLNVWLTGIVMGMAVPAVLVHMRLSRARAAAMLGLSPHERREFFYAELLSSIAAAKELRLFGLADLFRTRMLGELSVSHATQARQGRRELRTHSLLAGLTALLAAVGLVWAIHAATQGRLSIGDVSVFVAAVAGVQGALQLIVSSIGTSHLAMEMFRHYCEIEQARLDLPVRAEPSVARPLRTGIQLCDVWFRYGPDQPWILRGINLVIEPGQSLAIVGLNGAGKSTLIKLLCRFYDPTEGAIRWDGIDLRDLDVDSVRNRIGAVFQDYMSYELSAAENIGVGDLRFLHDEARIADGAARAGIHETLAALPRGYDTLLSKMFFDDADRRDPQTGVLLSGGQWQRVALARAFLRGRRDLMILDEPSAGLDAEAEFDMHQRLRRHGAGGATVLISHRLSAVRAADRIVVLADGHIVEDGTHSELMASTSRYARLFRLQASGYEQVDRVGAE